MNIESFKRHTASRKPKPIPLRTKKTKVRMPDVYYESPEECKTVCMEPCRVTHVNTNAPTQVIILDLDNPAKFNQWVRERLGTDRDSADIRLSRFQRAFGGMMNPRLRYWTVDAGVMKQVQTKIQPGDVVQCAFTPRVAKHKLYFDLHRDILIKKQKETKKYQYFSDED